MKEGLLPGMTHELKFRIPREKTVPFLYPESQHFREMPEVFATGYMVGLMEWACIDALAPFLEAGEGSLGTMINVTHVAPTPPGMTVTVHVKFAAISGRKIEWEVEARDDVDVIGSGRHGRTVVSWDRFKAKVEAKSKKQDRKSTRLNSSHPS